MVEDQQLRHPESLVVRGICSSVMAPVKPNRQGGMHTPCSAGSLIVRGLYSEVTMRKARSKGTVFYDNIRDTKTKLMHASSPEPFIPLDPPIDV